MTPPDMIKIILFMQSTPGQKQKKAYPERGTPSKDAKLYLPALALPRSGSKGIISARDHYAPSTPESSNLIFYSRLYL